MIRLLSAFLATVVLTIGASAQAGTLTCEAFKSRLGEAMRSLGPVAAAPHAFTLDHDGGASGLRLGWHDASGVSGRLTCGEGDAFADFYMTLDPERWTGSDHSAAPSRFMELGAASVCALSEATPDACRDFVATMTEEGLDQYKDDVAQKDDRPQGLRDYDLSDGLDAVFYVTRTGLSWAVGPGVSSQIDSARAPLVPHERDDDDDN